MSDHPPDDHFAALGLPRRADLDPAVVKERFHQLSRQHHPDRASPGERPDHFESLNRAQAVLSDTPQRLRHLHELQFGDLDRAGSISDPLMAHFSEVGAALQAANALANKKEAAQSALAKALLEAETPTVLATITAAQSHLADALRLAEARLPGIEPSPHALAAAYRDLAFLTRWRTQLQAAFARLV
ncbi:hypothetical protein BH23VER1_BH23VER1_15190 [soil metagenome]